MTVPLWVLLGFAAWTLATLTAGVGLHRWSAILAGRARPTDFPADTPHGPPRYRRAMRAHANCVENLPVYAAVVVAAVATGADGAALDGLAAALMAARIGQTTVHVAFAETARTVALRFAFFAVQVACMTAMGLIVAVRAAG